MTLPITLENGVPKIPESRLGDVDIPSAAPRITVNEDVLERDTLAFRPDSKWFTEGAFVAIKYEIHNELQFSSAYVMTSAYKNSDELWRFHLKPTHGGASALSGKQAYHYDNKLVLRRHIDKVRGGAKMVLSPIEPEHIMEHIEEPQVVAHTI